MSQKLSLVQFELEEEIPIDETSKKIKSAYVPDDFVDFMADRKLSAEIDIKESAGIAPDIPIVLVGDIDGTLHEVEVNLARFIQEAHMQVSGELLVEKEVESSYRDLLVWLKIREILKLKQSKYIEDSHIKIVVG